MANFFSADYWKAFYFKATGGQETASDPNALRGTFTGSSAFSATLDAVGEPVEPRTEGHGNNGRQYTRKELKRLRRLQKEKLEQAAREREQHARGLAGLESENPGAPNGLADGVQARASQGALDPRIILAPEPAFNALLRPISRWPEAAAPPTHVSTPEWERVWREQEDAAEFTAEEQAALELVMLARVAEAERYERDRLALLHQQMLQARALEEDIEMFLLLAA